MTELVADVLRRYADALQFLESLGVRWANTRLDRYRRILAAGAEVETGELARTGKLKQLASALYEVSDILDIAMLDARHFEEDVVALTKLRSISSGRDFTQDYKPGELDAARDNAFELSAAAHLQTFDAFAGFSRTNGDVLIRDGRCVRPGECKRLTAKGGLNDQIDKAVRQIRKQYKDHRAPAGLILMDVTAAAQTLDSLHIAASEQELMKLADSLLTDVVLTSRNIFQKGNRHPPEVLGMAIRLNVIGQAGEPNNLRRITTWQFVDFQFKGSPESLVFRALAASLSLRGLVDHTDWEPSTLLEAVASLYPGTLNTLVGELFAAGYGAVLEGATSKR